MRNFLITLLLAVAPVCLGAEIYSIYTWPDVSDNQDKTGDTGSQFPSSGWLFALHAEELDFERDELLIKSSGLPFDRSLQSISEISEGSKIRWVTVYNRSHPVPASNPSDFSLPPIEIMEVAEEIIRNHNLELEGIIKATEVER